MRLDSGGWMVRGFVAIFVVTAVSVIGVGDVSAAVPPTISGLLFSNDHAGSAAIACDSSNPDVRVMTMNWANFVSQGPGGPRLSTNNHVSGTLTLGPQVFTDGFATYAPPVSAVTAIDLSFTVDRPAGYTVTGTIHLSDLAPTSPPDLNFGKCVGLLETAYGVYSATMSDGTTSVVDQGTVSMTFIGDQRIGFVSYADDHTAPTIRLGSPADGVNYVVGEPVSNEFSCVDALSGWGVATCDLTVDGVSVPVGGIIDTSSVGSHTFTIRASDRGGNATSQSGSFNVTAGSASGDASTGYLTTDSTGFGPTPSVPIQTWINVPCCLSGPLSIALQPTPAPGGFSFFGKQVVLTGPEADPSHPYQVTFSVDGSLLGATPPESVQVYRNGAPVPDCSLASGNSVADPDPCVAGRYTNGDDVQLYVLTSGFSTWNFGPPVVVADSTPPTITPVLAGQLGANGWYRSDVAVSWTVTDPESAITSTGLRPDAR